MENHHFSWETYKWPFSIAMLVITRGYLSANQLSAPYSRAIFQIAMSKVSTGLHTLAWVEASPVAIPWRPGEIGCLRREWRIEPAIMEILYYTYIYIYVYIYLYLYYIYMIY